MTNALQIPETGQLLETMMQNLCLQVIGLQNDINNRPEGQRFPSMPETNQMVRMIGCIDRLRKAAASSIVNREMSKFIRFTRKTDKELATKMELQFNEYSNSGKTQDEAIQEPEQEAAPTPLQEIVATGPQNTAVVEEPAVAVAQQGKTDDKLFTITAADFEKYKHLLYKTFPTKNEKVEFNGEMCNLPWLQFNLFQWCQPEELRLFVADEKYYHREINYYYTSKRINQYINLNGTLPSFAA